MMLPKLKKYDKKFDFSYTFGAYPTIDLIKKRPELVLEVILNPDGKGSDGIAEVLNLCSQHNIPISENKNLIERIAFKENTYVVGVFKKYGSKIALQKNHVLLVNPSNTGNLGTVIRTMAGFGIFNLAIISPAVDIFDPKVIRSSMGAFFSINFEYFSSIKDYTSVHANNMYSFMLNAKYEIDEVEFEPPFTIVLGNEGSGLPDKYRDISTTVYIKHLNIIDSLNMSVCAGIALFKARNH